jgi:hypothetical protein
MCPINTLAGSSFGSGGTSWPRKALARSEGVRPDDGSREGLRFMLNR